MKSLQLIMKSLQGSFMKTLLIAGGGTGGHIYPGLAISDLKPSDWQVHFVGTKKGLETQIVPQHIPLHFLPIQGWQGVGFLNKLKVGILLPFAFAKSIYLLLKLRPHYILGMGGYASGPILFMGALMGFHTAIWEMNAYPGLTNRILSWFVKECWVVFESSKVHLKTKHVHFTAIPVRKEIVASASNPGLKNILIFGGSRGAKGINQCVVEWIKQQSEYLKKMHIRFQTGSLEYDGIQRQLQGLLNVHVCKYLDQIGLDYQWADVVICRAGASTLAELATTQKAAILIPFPYATEDHQRKNAEILFKKKACRMILEKDLTPQRLESELLELMHNLDLKKEMEQNIAKWHKKDAWTKIADRIFSN